MPRRENEVDVDEASISRKKRKATVYDVVAGRIGTNGFLTYDEVVDSTKALGPEEVLMRKTSMTPDEFIKAYQTDAKLADPEATLPNSDLLKAIHTYASDFYSRTTPGEGAHDFRSLDGTALIALGYLLEEATEEILGENGDMALVEPRYLSTGLPESALTRNRIHGKVRPPPTPPLHESSSDGESSNQPAKKQRR